MEALQEYKKWLNEPLLDDELKKELLAMEDDEERIKECFYQELEFGTAGLRAKIGVGTNRMNVIVVSRATQGLAEVIKQKQSDNPSMVIGYDSRHKSAEFALKAASVLCANGIKTYLFDGIRTVPEVSFAVRELECCGGIMITASHNPPEYNGYKVYDHTGSQLDVDDSVRVMKHILKVDTFRGVKCDSHQEATDKGLLCYLSEEMDTKFLSAVKSHSLKPKSQLECELKVVYTPLHGAGMMPITRVLAEESKAKVYVVEEQSEPNGDFPTVKTPNPEDPKAFKLAEKLGKKVGAQLLIATDPDGDRLGVSVRKNNGAYKLLTGNQIGCIMLEYKLNIMKKYGQLPKRGRVVRSIVSTNMADRICEEYNVKCDEVLTGFRFIGEKINTYIDDGDEFVFAFEESYGYLIGAHVRDKDAIGAAMMIVEAAEYYLEEKGYTLLEVLNDMYNRYGCYIEKVGSFEALQVDGMEKIAEVMKTLRENPPKSLGGFAPIVIRDYEARKKTILKDGIQMPIEQPKSNMLYFELENDMSACIRPSGTEPKLKFYTFAKGKDDSQACLRSVSLYKGVGTAIRTMLED